MRTRVFSLSFALLALVAARGPAAAGGVPPRPAGGTGTVVVPDRFLRRFDAVTVFFDRELGPPAGGSEDRPQRFARLAPAHPGAWTWLDGKTLQFRPADPWPPLARFTVSAEGVEVRLATLLAAPIASVPARGAEDLEPVDAVALTFPEPVDAAALARLVTIELRPLPGVGTAPGETRLLTGADLAVKPVERAAGSDPARYVLALAAPIPLGTRARLRLRLAEGGEAAEASYDLEFATAEPFRVLAAGCRRLQYPIGREGTRYGREQAIACDADAAAVVVELSNRPAEVGPVAGRNLVQIEPPVADLEWRAAGKSITVTGRFAPDTLYRVRIGPAGLRDVKGRPLEAVGPSELYLHFPRKTPYLRFARGHGIVERFGPKMVPLEGRGDEAVDVRVLRIDPLDRSTWPFPRWPIAIDESERPAGPGEEPGPFTQAGRHISPDELAEQIRRRRDVPWSRIVKLPLRRDGGAASFGLDLGEAIESVGGKGAPGHYLVGVRRLDGSSERSWMRVQATDLALTAVDEPAAVQFHVTSLASGQPVAGATVRIEGHERFEGRPGKWTTFGEGVTDARGGFRWVAPGEAHHLFRGVLRIVVERDGDVLVLDPGEPPDRFADNQWHEDRETWLQWALRDLAGREPQARLVGHVFAERPVYRPEDPVHVRGWIRRRDKGQLFLPGLEGNLVIQGPGDDLVWRYPLALSPTGGFYHRFEEKDLPTGRYAARFELPTGEVLAETSFRKEAYRIPRFEVRLHAPDRTPLDREFAVKLLASYYAGGKVAARPVTWRVTQFPETWTPRRRPGFEYSSDARFSRAPRFESSPRLDREATTGEDGSAELVLNPAVEPTAQPRSYVIEATVTGADDQTVTATARVLALPPFVLGLKVPRFLENRQAIEGEMLVAGPDGEPLADQPVTVRLVRREWHSRLRASDFSDGIGRYETDVVDTRLGETQVRSAKEPLPLRLPIPGSGVYLVELESHDRLGRAQVVSVDLFAAGAEPVSWPKPAGPVFTVATDKDSYEPGETARLLLESPFQSGRALAVVEAPDGNRYEWVEVAGGQATFALPIVNRFAPRLPVHFLLERGRLAGSKPGSATLADLGRPQSIAATIWVKVEPTGHRLRLGVAAPDKALPGETIKLALTLADPRGLPLAGEVTLWLVDQAVLALGKEARLDPVPDFLTEVESRLGLRDTRNLAFGWLPFAENPGGDAGEEAGLGLLDRATVRKRFEPVPFYEPSIQVGPDGRAEVEVRLPDDVTNFKIRAKAASGAERFGWAEGMIQVRLPVVVQPALPRFVRPGDAFVAAAVGRVVEGEAGPGAAEIRVEGAMLAGPARRSFAFEPERAERLEWQVSVPTPPAGRDGRPALEQARFHIGVERLSDRAADAVDVRIPVREDRAAVVRRELISLEPGKPWPWPAPGEPARPGTVRRELLLASEPGIVAMAAGLDHLRDYPFGCTEQRLSRARGEIALRGFRQLLGQKGGEGRIDKAVQDTLEWLPQVIGPDGLVSYWPGDGGYVSLTAWVLEFLVEAREAGFAVDARLQATVTSALERALRSDYAGFIDGEAWAERAWALQALARAGRFDPGYAAELARSAQFLGPEGTAEVAIAFSFSPDAAAAVLPGLARRLGEAVVARLHQGREIYGGLQGGRRMSGLVLPSETRTVAEMVRALRRIEPAHPRLPLLVEALVTLGRGDGWGSTNADAAALRALSEVLKPGAAGAGPARTVAVRLGGERRELSVGGGTPVASFASAEEADGEVALAAGAAPVLARAESRFVPAAPGSEARAEARGFVVAREIALVRPGDAPPERIELDAPGRRIEVAVGDVIEEHVTIVNPEPRHYVAVVVPLAAGVEPLNPDLATAPPEARPGRPPSLAPSYLAMLDDRVEHYWTELPKGSFDVYFRARATVAGSFTIPAASAEMMYDGAVRGTSNGARLEVRPRPR